MKMSSSTDFFTADEARVKYESIKLNNIINRYYDLIDHVYQLIKVAMHSGSTTVVLKELPLDVIDFFEYKGFNINVIRDRFVLDWEVGDIDGTTES